MGDDSATRTGNDGSTAAQPPVYEHLHQHGPLAIMHLFNGPPEAIPRYDLAEMNLICAFGLPGTEDMDMGAMLRLLDTWASRVAVFTRQNRPLFESGRLGFESLAEYQVGSMIHVVTREFGVRYNPERMADPDNFSDPADTFIHGILGPRRMGTCASLPVLFTALGRRLGYPLKLVEAPGHLFYRWDEPGRRFNVEYHEQGMNCLPDEHYRQWPQPWPPALLEQERRHPTYLISLTPRQELALCATLRAQSLDYVGGRRHEAASTMQVAHRLWPSHRNGVWMNHLVTKARYPERDFPSLPCEQTAGRAVVQEAARQGLLQPAAAIRQQRG